MLFIIAAHDTTSHGIAWTLYCLIRDPLRMRKAVQEVDDVLERYKEQKIEPDLNHYMQDFPYLTACFREAARLYPPGSDGSPRVVTKEDFTLDDCAVPVGTVMWHVFIRNFRRRAVLRLLWIWFLCPRTTSGTS